MNRFLHAFVLAFTIFMGLPAASPASPGVGEWTMFGNGPEHNGYYPRTIGAAPFTPAWSSTFPVSVTQVVVSADAVYGTTSNYFGSGQSAFALNVSDGTKRWSFPLASAYSVNPPAYANGRLYFQRGDGYSDTHLWCLDAASGLLNWASPHAAQWENYLAPTVANGGVFVNGGDVGGMYGFDAVTGARRFFVAMGQEDGWTPGYANGVVYSCVNGKFIATDPQVGSPIWSRDLTAATPSWNEGDVPVVYDNKVILRVPGRLIVMDTVSRTQSGSVDGSFSGTPAVADGTVYVLSGAEVKAFSLADGSALGTFTAAGSLKGQPLLTKDLLLVSNDTNTYIFNRGNYALQQVLNVGGALSYAAGRLYVAAGSTLSTFTVAATELDPPPSPLPPPAGPQTRPNPDRVLGTTTAAWLDCARNGQVAYFLFGAPAKIERFDLTSGTWLTPIPLPDGPTAFTVSATSIYVGFGSSISAFPLDGSSETVLGKMAFSVKSIIATNNKLYVGSAAGDKVVVVDPATGASLSDTNFTYAETGLSLAPTKNKIFGVSSNVSPSDILQLPLNGDGTLGMQTDSPYHGFYPSGTRTFVFGDEARVATNAGIIYSTGDLTYLGSLAGAFTDGDFTGASPVLLRDQTLVGYSVTLLETGRKTLAGQPLRLYVAGANVFTFAFQTGRGAIQTVTPLTDLVPPDPGMGIDPTNLVYTPDAIELGAGNIVYLLSRLHLSIFRWSIADRRYLPTIPLAEAPQRLAYSSANDRLYLSYSTGRISKIDVATSLVEVNFANAPQVPGGLVAAGEYLFVEDSSASGTHYTYSSAGVLLYSKPFNYYSQEYIWNAVNRKMYFFRDGISPNDVLWEDIDSEGKFGAEQDSPYHGTYTISHPLRVSPDGAQVLLGNGDFYAGVSLVRLGTLSIPLADAAWLNGVLATASSVAGAPGSNNTSASLKTWTADNKQVVASGTMSGTPLRLLALSDSFLLVTQSARGIAFARLDAGLQPISVDPAFPSTPPEVVTTNATFVDPFSATLNGSTNPRGLSGTASFDYGLSTTYGMSTVSVSIGSGQVAQLLSQAVAQLQPGATYHFRVVASNSDGTTYGADQTFTTIVPLPLVFNDFGPTDITSTSATVVADVFVYGAQPVAHVEYGTSTDLGSVTASAPVLGTVPSRLFGMSLTGLEPGTLYYYRIVVTDASGTGYSPVRTFSTVGARGNAAITLGANDITQRTAVLFGSVTPVAPGTLASFQYGVQSVQEQSTYRSSLPGSGIALLTFPVSGLLPGTTYQFRIVATSPTSTFVGETLEFTTAGSRVHAADDRAVLIGRKPVVIDVLANDTGAPLSELQITSVSPALAGSVSINANKTITYQPSGPLVALDRFTYNIQDVAGNRSSASVTVRNDLSSEAGSYHALVGNQSSGFHDSGFVAVTVSAGGSFTGTAGLGEESAAFVGSFDSNYSSTCTLGGGAAILTLKLDGAKNQLTGTVSRLGGAALPFAATKMTSDRDRSVPLAGRYTLLLPAIDQSQDSYGFGFALMNVDARGFVQVAGQRRDGGTFATAAMIGADGQFPLYALSGKSLPSSLHGWVGFRDLSKVSDCDGQIGSSLGGTQIAGVTMAGSGSGSLPAVEPDTFTTVLSLVGSRYVPATGSTLVIPVPTGTGNTVLSFGQNSTILSGPTAATLTAGVLSAPGLSNLAEIREWGLFSGRVSLSGSLTPFAGVFFQKQAIAAGAFSATNGSGWVLLEGSADPKGKIATP